MSLINCFLKRMIMILKYVYYLKKYMFLYLEVLFELKIIYWLVGELVIVNSFFIIFLYVMFIRFLDMLEMVIVVLFCRV